MVLLYMTKNKQKAKYVYSLWFYAFLLIIVNVLFDYILNFSDKTSTCVYVDWKRIRAIILALEKQ
jgi:hypothetical protein